MNPTNKPITHRRAFSCGFLYLLLGLTSVIIGIFCILSDFQELALIERIKVRPGLPAYDRWKNPSQNGIDVGIKVYLFAVENPNEFLTNKTAKLKLKEVGPIVYKKIIHQEDVVFHEENSTLSFTTAFRIEFDEGRTEPGILNQSLVVVNPMLLGFAALAHDMFLARMAFNLIANDDHVFLNRTVYQLLWDNTSPIFDFVRNIPFAAPRQNAGIMFNSFYPSDNRFNVNIGPKHGYENFFKMNTYNGMEFINEYGPNYPKHCPISLKGACEGTGLPPHLKKEDVIYAYTKNLCRTYPMVYDRTVDRNGVKAYKFVLADEIYTRLENPDLDCFKKSGDVNLPDGLSDVSKCTFGLPTAVSNPHFWGYRGEWVNYLDGLKPNESAHASHVYLEPISGVQLEGIARIQSNIVLPNLHYFAADIRRFSGMILPQFWMEYFVINNDPLIHGLLALFLSLPVIQIVCIALMLILSVVTLYKVGKIAFLVRTDTESFQEKELNFEQQMLFSN